MDAQKKPGAPKGSKNATKLESEKLSSSILIRCMPAEKDNYNTQRGSRSLSAWARAKLNKSD